MPPAAGGLAPGAVSTTRTSTHATCPCQAGARPAACNIPTLQPLIRLLVPCQQVLRSITEVFGKDIWFSTVLLLTHGGAPPPDTRCVCVCVCV